MTELIAPLTYLTRLRENAVHRADRAEVPALFIEQSTNDLRRRHVDESFRVRDVHHLLPFFGGQRTRWSGPRLRARGYASPVERRSRNREHGARSENTDKRDELFDGVHSFSPFLSGVGRSIPNAIESFFWTSMIASACTRRC